MADIKKKHSREVYSRARDIQRYRKKVEFEQRVTEYNKQNKERSQAVQYYSSAFTKVLGVVFCIMLIIMIIRITQGNQPPTFTGLLEKLSTAPVPTIPFINSSSITIGNGGTLFGWLTDFLRLFVDMFNVIIFLINGFMSILTYVLWLLQWIFSA